MPQDGSGDLGKLAAWLADEVHEQYQVELGDVAEAVASECESSNL